MYNRSNLFSNFTEKLVLLIIYFGFGIEYYIFCFLKFRSNKSFCICQSLLSYIIVRNLIIVRLGNFNIITEKMSGAGAMSCLSNVVWFAEASQPC